MGSITAIRNEQGYGAVQQAAGFAAAPVPGQDKNPDRRLPAAADGRGLYLPEDRVTLSGRAAERAQQNRYNQEAGPGEKTVYDGKSAEQPEVKQAVERLKRIEEKVKAHEAAHKAAGGNLAGSASYSYTQGPDGRNYVTGGEVQIDMSGGNTPEETITRMQQVIRAALAPADPSGQDRAVAAQAANQMNQAQQEKQRSADSATKSEVRQPLDPLSVPAAGSRIQQAYGDPAVRGADPIPGADTASTPAFQAAGQSRNSSRDPALPLFSSFV